VGRQLSVDSTGDHVKFDTFVDFCRHDALIVHAFHMFSQQIATCKRLATVTARESAVS
jgi:hypothetical protein